MNKFKFSFDGKGINDKTSEYAPRLVTFTEHGLSKPGLGELLEAAPEMYEALKKITEFQYNPDGTLMNDADANTAQVKIARDAIAKIEGK